jgi:hypothetical protein
LLNYAPAQSLFFNEAGTKPHNYRSAGTQYRCIVQREMTIIVNIVIVTIPFGASPGTGGKVFNVPFDPPFSSSHNYNSKAIKQTNSSFRLKTQINQYATNHHRFRHRR